MVISAMYLSTYNRQCNPWVLLKQGNQNHILKLFVIRSRTPCPSEQLNRSGVYSQNKDPVQGCTEPTLLLKILSSCILWYFVSSILGRNSFSITERTPGLSPASLKRLHESSVMKSRPPPSDFEMLNYNSYAENLNLVTTVIRCCY
jgi:hypothetical protein